MQRNITLHSKSVKPQRMPRTDRWYKICCLSHAVVCAVRRCFSLFLLLKEGFAKFPQSLSCCRSEIDFLSWRVCSEFQSFPTFVSPCELTVENVRSPSLSKHGGKLFIDPNFAFNFTPNEIFVALWNDSTICNLLLC